MLALTVRQKAAKRLGLVWGTWDMAEARQGYASASITALGVIALIFAAFWFRASLLELDPVRAQPARGVFNTASAVERLKRVLDGTPHAVDSDALDATRGRLLAEIRSMGYTPELRDETACNGNKSGSLIRCARVQNILFAAGPPARDADTPVTILTAHYDSVDASPGFGDDGIGVAVWLEIADLFRDQPPAGPVLFLLTDGEETALLGAKAFVDNKAYGRKVGAIVNLEARGVRGPAIMFETSTPNAAVVLPWSRNGARPISNSMTAAVYRLLPNSTDLTVHFTAGYPGVNIAIGDGLSYYHTSRDDLSELDPRSVQHMGDQALGAARAFAADGLAPAGDVVYSDFGARLFVMMPQGLALALLVVCFLIAAGLLFRAELYATGGFSWSAFLLPPATAIGATGLAFGLQSLLGALRSEPVFWSAHPQAFNAAIFFGVILVACLGLSFFASHASRLQLFAAGWFWFLLAGLIAAFIVPGASILFVMPGLIFSVAAIAGFFARPLALPAWLISGLGVLIVFLPILYLLDVMMGLSIAPAFGLVEALMLAPLLCLIGPIPRGQPIVLGPIALCLIAAAVIAALVPAYSPAAPLAVNYTARLDPAAKTADLTVSQPYVALPEDLRKGFDVKPDRFLTQTGSPIAVKDAPFVAHPAATAKVEMLRSASGARERALRLSAPGARMVRLRIPASAEATRLSFKGSAPIPVSAQNGVIVIDCVGRACDGAVLEFNAEALDPKPGSEAWTILGVWSGLPESYAGLAPVRPATAVPIQTGDTTVAKTMFKP
jgi:hypothetical protein